MGSNNPLDDRDELSRDHVPGEFALINVTF